MIVRQKQTWEALIIVMGLNVLGFGVLFEPGDATACYGTGGYDHWHVLEAGKPVGHFYNVLGGLHFYVYKPGCRLAKCLDVDIGVGYTQPNS